MEIPNSSDVWRDAYGKYEHVGLIEAEDDHARFRYDDGYRGLAISVRLPVWEGPFPERDTEVAFEHVCFSGLSKAVSLIVDV